MKKSVFLGLVLLFSCHSINDKHEIKCRGINDSLLDNISIEIETQEDFYKRNNTLSYGVECVANKDDFEQLSKEELYKKMIIDDVITLKKVGKNLYRFSIDENELEKIKTYKCLYCRFTRPDFLFSEGYKSRVFQIKD